MQENLVVFFLEGGARAPNDPMHPPTPPGYGLSTCHLMKVIQGKARLISTVSLLSLGRYLS